MANGNSKGFFFGLWPFTFWVTLNAVIAALVTTYLVKKGGGDPPPEDRPPIVVMDGSILFQGGDTAHPGYGFKKWKSSGSGWRPDHDSGANVTDFTVTVGGNIVATGCASTTMTGDPVTIEFVPDPNAPQTTVKFMLTREDKGGGSTKKEPQVSSSETLTDTTLPTGGVPQLSADTSATSGYIAKVSVGTALSCTLAKPDGADARKAQRVTIQPNR